jgi:hypothetical protein
MDMNSSHIISLAEAYEDFLACSFYSLWSKVPIDPLALDAFSVIGALLSRQVTLSIQLARSPNTWNGHSAPLFLRSQIDLQITLAWILGELKERAKLFIFHGLGEEKLIIEHFVHSLDTHPDAPTNDLVQGLLEAKRAWINSQRAEWMVEVNLGNWSRLDTRKMAQESNCEGLYKFAYKPFSQAAHSMWPHISLYNARPCTNPLHRYHLVPELIETSLDIDYLFRSCKYTDQSYEAVIKAFAIEPEGLMPLDWLHQEIDRLTEEASTDEDSDGQMIGVQQPDPEDGTKD